MKTFPICGFAASLSVFLLAASPSGAADAVLSPGGRVRLSSGGRDCFLEPMAFLHGWTAAKPAGGYEIEEPGKVSMAMKEGKRPVLDVAVSLQPLDGGRARFECAFTALEDVSLDSIGVSVEYQAGDVAGRPWRAGEKRGVFAHPADGGAHLATGVCSVVELPVGAGGASLELVSSAPVDFLFQDNARWGRDTFVVRIGALGRAALAKGGTARFSFDLSATDGALDVRDARPCVIEAGPDWIPLDVRRDVEPGSALDFSGMGFADAPAGKHGWLRNVGGRFEFEGRPGVEQRFFGVNLCFSANFPDHALAETLAARFRRLGYNAVRIHHHDAMWTQSEENRDRLDYFLAKCFENGIYATTDLYVSRGRVIPWRSLGVDRDGTVNDHLFKLLCAVWDPAFENWAEFAESFLLHENPYTGRRYVDEPAMPLLSLVNEGAFFVGWYRGDGRDDPRVAASWKAWLEAKRAVDPAFAPGLTPDQTPRTYWERDVPPAVAQWTGELEANMVARMTARLRAIGCRALLSNDNCGSHYASLQKAAAGYGYVDDHFYIDHPTFPVTPWRLPAGSRNENPIRGSAPLPPSEQAFTRIFGKPFTVSEWNFPDPAQCRAAGALLAGTMAARQGWNGLFRFAYSHTRDGLGDRDAAGPHFFDLATDPLAQASERVVACLFARGDLPPLREGVALWCTDESAAAADKTYLGAPPWCDAAWKMRVGTCLSPEDAGPLRAIRREEADDMAMPDAPPDDGAVRIDRERGSIAVATPRTCGGFAEGGRVDAGALSFEIVGADPSAVWVSSLDCESIAHSSRLLLAFLTDVQGEGTKFADETRRILISRGGRPLARAGAADVELRLARPGACEVHALDSAGRRIGKIPSGAEDGVLRFRVSTRGPDGLACQFWEIASSGPR